MKTITFHENGYSITLRAEEIVATVASAKQISVFMRGSNEPFILKNTEHFDEWLDAIWENE